MGTQLPPVAGETPEGDAPPSFLLGLTIAGALIAWGMRRRGIFGTAAGVAGAGVLAALLAPPLATQAPPRRRSTRAIDVESEITVHRPRPAVFEFFRNFENFPLLGGLLHSVDDFDDGRSRWRVMGDDAMVEWDVIVTKYVPPRVIGWESVAHAPVESAGTVRFDVVDDATTRVCLSLHYAPQTEVAARAFRPHRAARPEHRVRAAIGRVESAMERAAQPGVHDRAPRYPLPDVPVGADDTSAPPGDATPQL